MNAERLRERLVAATTVNLLAALYIDAIGYDPFIDDASLTEDDVRDTLDDYISEVEAAEDDAALRAGAPS